MVTGPPALQSASLRVYSYFVIKATPGQAWLSGSMSEHDVRAGVDHTLEVRLWDVQWSKLLLQKIREVQIAAQVGLGVPLYSLTDSLRHGDSLSFG